MGFRTLIKAIGANIILLCIGALDASATVVVNISTGVVEHAVTKMAMGSGLVYLWEADSLYADGEVAHIIKDVGIGTLRWPGGTVVTVSHWDAFTGTWNDSWNPAYNPAGDLPPESFMGLDEYLDLIDRTGAEIMLGVNMSSGKEWNREADGINEARALVQACKDRGYDVKYIYFDNESYHEGNGYNRDVDGDGESWTPASYAESFNLYAAAVKQVFPSAKLIANWNNNVTSAAFQTDISTMFSIAGTNIDYVDIHFYWKWDTASWALWKTELPMKRAANSSYKDSVVYANNLFATLGYPHIKVAVMEWNLGPGPWQTDPEHNNFKTALVQTEMQMQFLQAGLDIGLIYALHDANTDPAAPDKHVIANNDPNATALWMWLFSRAVGKTTVQSASPAAGVYIVAAKGERGELVTYLLNKTDYDQTVEFDIPGYTVSAVSEAWRFEDGGSGAGVLRKITLWETAGKKRTTLLANSLNMIGFNYPAAVDSDGDGIEDAWETAQFGSLGVSDENSDFDGDGYSDLSEFLADTDPCDRQSSLRFRLTQSGLNSVGLGWRGRTGRSYTLEKTSNLVSGVWSPESSVIGSSGENLLSVQPEPGARFYRLKTAPPASPEPIIAQLLIAWDGGIGTNSSIKVTGVSGTLLNNSAVDATAGSTDGAFGSTLGGANTGLTAYPVRTAAPGGTDTLSVQIINNTGADIQLNSIVFDYAAWWVNSPIDVRVMYTSGDLSVSANTLISTVSVLVNSGKAGDYSDFEVSVAGLADNVLVAGQSATFSLVAGNAIGTTASGAFDNVGFTGRLNP